MEFIYQVWRSGGAEPYLTVMNTLNDLVYVWVLGRGQRRKEIIISLLDHAKRDYLQYILSLFTISTIKYIG